MLNSLAMLEQQVSRTDQQLMMHLVIEQRETNRLLKEILGQSTQEEVKRPELMKRMAALENKPKGFHKWSNEQMLEHLKGVS